MKRKRTANGIESHTEYVRRHVRCPGCRTAVPAESLAEGGCRACGSRQST